MHGRIDIDLICARYEIQKEKKMQEELIMAKRLETYLNDLIWSQAELARRADVSVATVKRALDDLPITRETALKMAKAIGDEIGERLTIRDFSGLKVEAITTKKRDTRKRKATEEK